MEKLGKAKQAKDFKGQASENSGRNRPRELKKTGICVINLGLKGLPVLSLAHCK
jgi:hypothetical protein